MTMLVNEQLAQLMNHNPDYFVSIEETHHKEKLDSPSGTAITLAQGIIDKNDYYSDWCESDDIAEEIIPIIALREPNVPGTHIVRWENEIDRIEIKHEAKSRKGFALGAVIAAEWLHGKRGMYSMRDVLNNTI
ncbi:UNVERIFIED_CONTAM: hypothetical protein GTU68_027463 [Idotea baltica]|nr:hypothetical protein [Idotea baltica]